MDSLFEDQGKKAAFKFIELFGITNSEAIKYIFFFLV